MKLAPLVVAASTLSLGLFAFAQAKTEAPAETAAPAEASTPAEADAPAEAATSVTVEEAKADPANWRAVDPERLFIFDTNKGRILIEAFPEVGLQQRQRSRTTAVSAERRPIPLGSIPAAPAASAWRTRYASWR